jgi:hypothetical protein
LEAHREMKEANLNLKEELIREYSKEQVVKLANYIGDNADRFAQLMELFFSPEYRISQRASWVMSHCADRHPQLIIPYMEAMIQNLDNPLHDAVIRNTVRIFQDIEIPEPLMGEIADKCFNYLNSPQYAIAIRVFSMTVLYKISLAFPELQNELKMVIEEYLPFGSAGFKSRGKKILKNLEKLRASA